MMTPFTGSRSPGLSNSYRREWRHFHCVDRFPHRLSTVSSPMLAFMLAKAMLIVVAVFGSVALSLALWPINSGSANAFSISADLSSFLPKGFSTFACGSVLDHYEPTGNIRGDVFDAVCADALDEQRQKAWAVATPALVLLGLLVALQVLNGIAVLLTATGGGIAALSRRLVRRDRHRAGGLPSAPTAAAGWLPDPFKRHDYRWWDGGAWTSHVQDHNQPPSEDPM